MGRAHGGGRPAPGRVHRARQLREADRRRGHARPAGLHVHHAEGPGAVHGREVPAQRLPPVHRGRDGRRAPRPPRRLPARRPRPRAGAGPAGLRLGGRSSGGRLRPALPAQRVHRRVHLRERPRPGRARARAEGRALLAAHPVRVPRCHPPGVRQLRHRADLGRDPRCCSASSASSGRSTRSRWRASSASSPPSTRSWSTSAAPGGGCWRSRCSSSTSCGASAAWRSTPPSSLRWPRPRSSSSGGFRGDLGA